MYDQHVAALRARVDRAAGHRHHLAPHIARQPRGDERARFLHRLDDDGALRKPGDDPVAIGEMPRARFGARGLFGDQQPTHGDHLLQLGIVGRVGDVDPAGDHADRRAGPLGGADRSLVRRGIDPARQPRHDARPVRDEVVRDLAREAAGRGGGIARADQRDARSGGRQRDVAADDQRGRRAVDLGQQRRVIGVVQEQIARARSLGRRDLARYRARSGTVGARPPPRAASIGNASIAASALP